MGIEREIGSDKNKENKKKREIMNQMRDIEVEIGIGIETRTEISIIEVIMEDTKVGGAGDDVG